MPARENPPIVPRNIRRGSKIEFLAFKPRLFKRNLSFTIERLFCATPKPEIQDAEELVDLERLGEIYKQINAGKNIIVDFDDLS